MDINLALIGAFLGAGLSVGIGALGAASGVGYASGRALEAMTRQPTASPVILRTMLIGQAITETSSIFALLVSLMLLFKGGDSSVTIMLANLSAGACIGLGALGSGVGAGLPVGSAVEGIGRKPENSSGLMISMLIGQAVTQTAVIFALVVSLLLLFQVHAETMMHNVAILGAGLAMGFGAIGPGVGAGITAQMATKAIAYNSETSKLVTTTMLLGQSVSQSTAIYSLVIAMILMFMF
ncbi:MAG: ATP synthase F0 subunit C [Candidatus Margulisbacteria bacterium]|nr:ATP synthase F0 subunit C [Candidatus Margulisiibacteriota bacterium]